MALPSRKEDLISHLDSLLGVQEVAAQHTSQFFDSLGSALETVVLFSEEHTTEALEVLWHVIDRVPAIFGLGFDADEVTEFCTFLVEDTLRVACRERQHLSETVERLMAAYVDERDAEDHFAAMPELLYNPKLPKRVRELAAAEASRLQGRHPEQQRWLNALAAKAPRTSA